MPAVDGWIKNKAIVRSGLYHPKETHFRLDVFPFFILLNLALLQLLSALISETGGGFLFSSDEELFFSYLLIGCVVLLEAGVLLGSEWSVSFACFVRYNPVDNVRDAMFIAVFPVPNKGKPEICLIQKKALDPHSSRTSSSSSSSSPSSEDTPQYHFTFQKQFFQWRASEGLFAKAKYPVHESFRFYQLERQSSSALGLSADKLRTAVNSFPSNRLSFPAPDFKELYKEHALAPFFVFQVFCCLLWMLDDFWMFSLFTLAMLCMIEGVFVRIRMANQMKLRAMIERPSMSVRVLRAGKWTHVNSDELYPGDIVSFELGGKGPSEILVPCDCLLLAGSCIVSESMLTGESKPQRKESIAALPASEKLNFRRDRDAHILSAGTTLVQNFPLNSLPNLPPLPGVTNTCIGYVLRTGFDTDQGSLLRTIMFSASPVTANNPETGRFIWFLLAFALVAAGYVINNGIEVGRGSYKLFLESSFIITAVIPPELPLVLSVAVNSALKTLVLLGVFCTEPFRVPYAGRIDVACFDKTGTLTSDFLILRGFSGLSSLDPLTLVKASSSSSSSTTASASSSTPTASSSSSPSTEISALSQPLESQLTNYRFAELVVAGCHSLMARNDGSDVIGDSMEVISFKAINWQILASLPDDPRPVQSSDNRRVRIHRRFPFTSTLKRMTTVATVTTSDRRTHKAVLCKGAPEFVRAFLAEVPDYYDQTNIHFSLEGGRVLALAYRLIDSELTIDQAMHAPRAELEKDLQFAGFLVFSCPLKPDSQSVLTAIHASSHRSVMITGDNVLTACHAARALSIISRSLLIVRQSSGSAPGQLVFYDPSKPSNDEEPVSEESINRLRPTTDFAISGTDLQYLIEQQPIDYVRRLVNLVDVFARVTPQQKEFILTALNHFGHQTLMCGDGTNDVGALKQAHVGMALVTSVATNQKPAASASSNTSTKNARSKPAAPAAPAKGGAATAAARRAQAQQLIEQLNEQMEADEQTIVRLGDASIAAPFSTRSTSIKPLLALLGQGRCTLVTTYQMFTILALNSLLNAYCLSVLYVAGVKFGDTQMTVSAFLITLCFMTISQVKPLSKLSSEKPPSRLFSPRLLFSIFSQLAIHGYAMIYLVDLVREFEPVSVVDLDAKFSPTLINSTVFLLSVAMQVVTFIANYQGPPFTQSMLASRPFMSSLLAVSAFVFILALELIPGLNRALELVPFPPEFKPQLLKVLTLDCLAAVVVEQSFRFLRQLIFRPKNPRSIRF